MSFSWNPADPDAPLPQGEVDSICTQSGRAIKNFRTILPHFEQLLKERQPLPDAPEAVQERRTHFTLFSNLVSRFEYMHQKHCGGRQDGNITRKTPRDFDDVMLAMPFHSLLELTIKRETDFDRKEDEYYGKMQEMDFYIKQMKDLGVQQGTLPPSYNKDLGNSE